MMHGSSNIKYKIMQLFCPTCICVQKELTEPLRRVIDINTGMHDIFIFTPRLDILKRRIFILATWTVVKVCVRKIHEKNLQLFSCFEMKK